MQSPWITRLVLAVIVSGLGALALDWVIVTDQERIEEFVEAVTGEVRGDRIDKALEYVDVPRQSVEIVVDNQVRFYEGNVNTAVAEEARQTLAPFAGDNVRLLQDSIEVEEDHARVALRASTPEGVLDVQFRLIRHDDQWLVSRVRVL